MADYLTLLDLRSKIEGLIKHFKSSQSTMVDNIINMVYLNELMVCDDLYPLYWMVDFDDTLAALDDMTITAITQADPGVITVDAAHGLSTSDIISIYDIVGMTELNNRTYRVNTVPTTTTLSLIDLDGVDAIDTTSLTAYSSAGTILHRGRILATTGKDVQRLLHLRWHGEGKLTEITPAELESENKWWSNTPARPSRYMLRKVYSAAGAESNQLFWFPGSGDTYDLRYWFERRAPRLTAAANVPMLPHHFHDAIIAGAITRLAESNVQVENAVIWPSIYKNQILALQNFNRKYWKDHELEMAGTPYLL